MTGELDPARLFPGGTAVSRLEVYDWPGPGGLHGGSPHLHLACTEGYVVLAGEGALQTLGPDGYAETPLTPLTVAWFSPGVIHRLINHGGLQILVTMQNGGLPEAGDCVLTFPPEVLADPGAYQAAAALPDPVVRDEAGGGGAAAAAVRRRKDLAIEGFGRLRDQVAERGPGALEDFYTAAAALVRPGLPAWRERWEAGALAAARATGDHLDQLGDGRHGHLNQARLTVLGPPADRRWGNCGRLDAYPAYPAYPPDAGWPGGP